jgi:hypothetical protein
MYLENAAEKAVHHEHKHSQEQVDEMLFERNFELSKTFCQSDNKNDTLFYEY